VAPRKLDKMLDSVVVPMLKKRGFRRRGRTFVAPRPPNLLAVRILRNGPLFTADVAVLSRYLIEQLGEDETGHWVIRVGETAYGYDKWWDIHNDLDAAGATFAAALDSSLNAAEPLATDEGLRDALISSILTSPGPPSGPEEEMATALIRKLGPPDWLTR